MFSGIVEEYAEVVRVVKEQENLHLTLRCSFVDELKIDQSVSHNGVCLTVVSIQDGTYTVTAMKETIERSNIGLLKEGDKVNTLFPLGNGFGIDGVEGKKLLLVGGGVGSAPLYHLGAELKKMGGDVTFLIGARKKEDLYRRAEFEAVSRVEYTTEDGSLGEKGFVTNHSVLNEKFDKIYTCGPKPMMMAVAGYAKQNDIACEVSLENKMACGLGACLCCVEDTKEGHRCVCTEGPVFSIDELKW